MRGNMMDDHLLLSTLIEHAARFNSRTEIVSYHENGNIMRYDYQAAAERMRKLASALVTAGVNHGDRIGTIAGNTHRHYELFFAVPGIGAVLHTANPRLTEEHIAYCINHAGDRMLFFESAYLPLVRRVAPQLTTVEHYVMMGDPGASDGLDLPGALDHEALIDGGDSGFAWPQFDERSAAILCFTSATTGRPKGALYSHRSTMLHTLGVCSEDGQGVSGKECLLTVTPLFHANGWGTPYSTTASGAKLVLNGGSADPAWLQRIIIDKGVTLAFGVPTIWSRLLDHVRRNGGGLGQLRRVFCGGSLAPRAMIDEFAGHGVGLLHAWGMTEMNPFGSSANLLHKHLAADEATKYAAIASQGRFHFMIDAKLIGPDGEILPHDGRSAGDLYVRGPWVISRYYADPAADATSFDAEGWFHTGDICTIDADGYMRIVDRDKDMIKSGGEWISSVLIEDAAYSHPAVLEAAAIAVPHPTWGERPLLIVVTREGVRLGRAELLTCLSGKLARWAIPDDILFVTDLPRNGAGKIMKASLRELHRDHDWSALQDHVRPPDLTPGTGLS